MKLTLPFNLRRRNLSAFGATALLTAQLCAAQLTHAAVPGDYSGDGKADLAVANVDRAAGTTTVVARSSSTLQPITFNFSVPGDAIVTGSWFGDGKTYPGVVYVRDANKPLEWRVKNPAGGDNFFLYGIPGDTVPNVAYDLDGDGITDPVVVRNGRPGHFDGFKLWYVALSSAGGGVYETLFGLAGDKPFVGQDESGLGRLYVLRPGSSIWYGRSLKGTEVSAVQWGLPGDIAIPPQPIGGSLSHVVVRPYASGQVAFIRSPNGSSRTVALGGASTVPVLGNFFGLSNDFAFFDRSIASVGVKFPDGSTVPVSFGAAGQTIVAPNGQITQGSTTVVDTTDSDGNFGSCENVVSISKLPGILYKPINQHGGRGPTIIAQAKNRRIGKSTLEIRDVNCQKIGALGLFSAVGPYGERYYSKSGKGSKHTHTQLLSLAQRAGSSAILIEGKGMWIKIANPTNREGRL